MQRLALIVFLFLLNSCAYSREEGWKPMPLAEIFEETLEEYRLPPDNPHR